MENEPSPSAGTEIGADAPADEIIQLIKSKTEEAYHKALNAGSLDRWLAETTAGLLAIMQYIAQGGTSLSEIYLIAQGGLEYKKILSEMAAIAVFEELGGSEEAKNRLNKVIADTKKAQRRPVPDTGDSGPDEADK